MERSTPTFLINKGSKVSSLSFVHVCLFVSLSVRSFSACLGVLGLFKVSFCSMALVNKLVLLCSAFENDHPEAQTSLFSCHLDAS